MKLDSTGLLRALALSAALGALPAAATSQELRLEPTSLPAPLVQMGKLNAVLEASAVEPIGDGSQVLIAHDKHPALFVLDTASGRILGEPITSPRFPQLDGAGPKWEGMARDSEGHYYLIGAHSGKTDEERLSKSFFIRFRLKNGTAPAIDDASIVRWNVARALESVLKNEGLSAEAVASRKVEGLTIRESKQTDGTLKRAILVGLRAPTDKVRVFEADLSSPPSPEAELELRPAFAFMADPRERSASELTSLEHVPALGGCLVVTASEDAANVFHGNILWFIPDGETRRARNVATFEVAMKAEGLAVLGIDKKPERTEVKLLITYDNDPHATKIPSRFQLATLYCTQK